MIALAIAALVLAGVVTTGIMIVIGMASYSREVTFFVSSLAGTPLPDDEAAS